jgi:RNA polymerase sigma-70 factor (ECF subfamily)
MTKNKQFADEFVGLYSRNARRIYAFVRSMVPNQADAEDLAQEVGRVLWEKFDEYELSTDFLAWAIKIAHFKILHYRRNKGRSPVNLAEGVVELLDQEMIQSAAKQDSRSQALTDCISKLSPADRQVIDARYQAGETPQSVASSLGRSVDSIYRTLRRVHKLLFECVRRRLAEEASR